LAPALTFVRRGKQSSRGFTAEATAAYGTGSERVRAGSQNASRDSFDQCKFVARWAG